MIAGQSRLRNQQSRYGDGLQDPEDERSQCESKCVREGRRQKERIEMAMGEVSHLRWPLATFNLSPHSECAHVRL